MSRALKPFRERFVGVFSGIIIGTDDSLKVSERSSAFGASSKG